MRRRLGLQHPSAAIWKANAPGIGRGTETGHRRVPAMIARVELAVLHTDVGDEVRIKLASNADRGRIGMNHGAGPDAPV